jgi:biopolymer transport protein ExbD
MAESFLREGVRTVNRINVTPIIDVALVLVIVLLVTAPMLTVTDKSLELPPAKSRAGAGDERIFLTLGRDGRIGVDDHFVDRTVLASALHAALEDQRDAVVIVRADTSVPHLMVRDLLDEARAAGARRLAVATRPEDAP